LRLIITTKIQLMAFKDFFIEMQTLLESIQPDTLVQNPVKANNLKQTPSNINQLFKYINIWDDQVDDLIKAGTGQRDGYGFQFPAIFIELITGDSYQVGGGVTMYKDTKCYLHIFSFSLNDSDLMERNLEIYELRDTVKSKLLGFSPSTCSAFMSRYDAQDYKHHNITKYLLGFNFNLNDTKGSIFDSKSRNPLTFKSLTLNPLPSQFKDWVSGTTYYQNLNVVLFSEVLGSQIKDVYLCLTTNTDVEFNALNWLKIPMWVIKQWVINDYCYIYSYVYQCSISNADEIFNPNNWNLITHG
jgi:hypothetical protein